MFRQPRLILTLVVAPFLILVIFGLGYRQEPLLRTLLVVHDQDARLVLEEQQLEDIFRGGITLVGTSTDEAASREMLGSGEVELLVIAPTEPLETIAEGEQAVFQVLHREIDPVLKSSIRLVARLSVDAVNRRVLADVVAVAQDEAGEIEDPLRGVRETSSQLVDALESGDRSEAGRHLAQLRDDLDAAEAGTQQTGDLLASIAAMLGTTEEAMLTSVRDGLVDVESEDLDVATAAAREVERSVGELEEGLFSARQLAPELLVNPFRSQVEEIYEAPSEPGVFYSPATIVVLLQHLAVSLAALSMVRERQLGITEVFRASPLGSGEAIVGKYLGFGLIGLIVAAGLTGAMLSFGLTIRGPVVVYGGVMTLLIFASLGLGFVLSGVSETDTQAVQFSMITLLLSIFFTGFILPLEQLIPGVRLVSYLIPATYGIIATHDVVFRGTAIEPVALAGLLIYPLLMAVAVWWIVRRDVLMSPRMRRV